MAWNSSAIAEWKPNWTDRRWSSRCRRWSSAGWAGCSHGWGREPLLGVETDRELLVRYSKRFLSRKDIQRLRELLSIVDPVLDARSDTATSAEKEVFEAVRRRSGHLEDELAGLSRSLVASGLIDDHLANAIAVKVQEHISQQAATLSADIAAKVSVVRNELDGLERRRDALADELSSTRNVLLHAAGEQEDFRPLFLPGPPALVLWSGAVPRGLSQSNVRQNATVCIRGEPLSAGSPAGRGFQRRGPKFQPGPGAQPGHPTIFPPPVGGNAPHLRPARPRPHPPQRRLRGIKAALGRSRSRVATPEPHRADASGTDVHRVFAVHGLVSLA